MVKNSDPEDLDSEFSGFAYEFKVQRFKGLPLKRVLKRAEVKK
jgi:hypothetical protein